MRLVPVRKNLFLDIHEPAGPAINNRYCCKHLRIPLILIDIVYMLMHDMHKQHKTIKNFS